MLKHPLRLFERVKRGTIIALGVTGLLLVGGISYLFARTPFSGCIVHLVSDSSTDAPWRFTFQGKDKTGTLRPHSRDDVRLCWQPSYLAPAELNVTGRGNVTLLMDPYCSDYEVHVNETSILPAGRAACA